MTTPLRRLSLGAGEQGEADGEDTGSLGAPADPTLGPVLIKTGPGAHGGLWEEGAGPPSPAEAATSGYCGSLAPGYRQVRGDQEPADQAAGSGQLRSRIQQTSHFYLYFIFLLLLLFCVHFLLFFP